MRINLIKKGKNELKFEVDEGHTFCNLLQNVLLEDKAVELAGYDVPHPLFQSSIFYIRTRGSHDPKEALKRALKKIQSAMDELSSEFDRAMREWLESRGTGGSA